MSSIRSPAVAGTFYPGSAHALSQQVEQLLAAAEHPDDLPSPKALIVPHAGYIYSGAVAANAYARLARARERLRRVVLLGPAHRVALRGLALPGCEAFATPLGTVPIDQAGVNALSGLPQVNVSHLAHVAEHSLEVHLPFLQRTLENFSVLPLVVGDATAEEVAQVLDTLWGGEETLIVVSSDLSHYLPYQTAREVDEATARAILNLNADIHQRQACGAIAVNALMLAATRRHLSPELIDLRNSGDTAGERTRVVGYGSFAFHATQVLPEDAGEVLIEIARGGIARGLELAPPTANDTAHWLRIRAATFVTLKRAGDLRGCMGSLEAKRPLIEDVEANALAAAFHDPRFTPLTRGEFESTHIEVSLLSSSAAIAFSDESDLLRQLKPHIDGLILQCGERRATFLPQVWEQLPSPQQFLLQLKRKAGLASDYWSADIRVSRYTVAKWSEVNRPELQ
jgi:MEMO1 family protein